MEWPLVVDVDKSKRIVALPVKNKLKNRIKILLFAEKANAKRGKMSCD